MIRLSGIEVRLRPGAAPALAGLDLAVAPGEFVLLVGANGSGKSTLIRLVAGLLDADAGRVRVAPGANVGLVVQDPAAQVVGGSVARDVAFGLEVRGLPDVAITGRVERSLELLSLEALAWRSPQAVSGGEAQRVAIAGAVAAEAQLLLLDEPSSHLDAAGQAQLASTLRLLHREHGTTILMASQSAADLALADRVVVLRGGTVALVREPRMLAAELAAAPQLAVELGFEPPPVARLAHRLADMGLPMPPLTPLTITELAAQLGVRA